MAPARDYRAPHEGDFATIGVVTGKPPGALPSCHEIRLRALIADLLGYYSSTGAVSYVSAKGSVILAKRPLDMILGAGPYLEPAVRIEGGPTLVRVDHGLGGLVGAAAEAAQPENSFRAREDGFDYNVHILDHAAAERFAGAVWRALQKRAYAPSLAAILQGAPNPDYSIAPLVLEAADRLRVRDGPTLGVEIRSAIAAAASALAPPTEAEARLAVAESIGPGTGGASGSFYAQWFLPSVAEAAFATRSMEPLLQNKKRVVTATAANRVEAHPSHECVPEVLAAVLPKSGRVLEDGDDPEFALQLIFGGAGLLAPSGGGGPDLVRPLSSADLQAVLARVEELARVDGPELDRLAIEFDKAFGGGNGEFGPLSAEAFRRKTGERVAKVLGSAVKSGKPVTLVSCSDWGGSRRA